MPQDEGPWRRDPPPRRRRVWLWLALMAALCGGVWLLLRAFPGQVTTSEDQIWALRGVAMLTILSAGVLRARDIRWGEKARHAAIWIAVFVVFLTGYAYRDRFSGVGERLRSELSGSYPVASGDHQLVVAESEGGGYFITGRVNGQVVRFLVDTGSSETVLTPADAERLGLSASRLDFSRAAETANGVGYGAPFTADSLEVGPIRLASMPMMINQAPMSSSLLGMSFLKRLDSFQVRGHRLYLTWR